MGLWSLAGRALLVTVVASCGGTSGDPGPPGGESETDVDSDSDSDADSDADSDPTCPDWALACFDNDAGSMSTLHYLGEDIDGGDDVDGDGLDDVVVGAGGGRDGGRAFLFLGPCEGWNTTSGSDAQMVYRDEQDLFETEFLGDTNGDGLADVGFVYGTSHWSPGIIAIVHGPWEGARSVDDADGVFDTQELGLKTNTFVGPGDTNGDGLADMAAMLYDDTDKLLVFNGPVEGAFSPEDASRTYQAAITTDDSREYLADIAGAGDTNGDGMADIAVTSQTDDDESPSSGTLYILADPTQTSAQLSDAADAWVDQTHPASYDFGYVVSSAGDLNSDGYDDVAVEDMRESSGHQGVAWVYVFLGPLSGDVRASSAEVKAWVGDPIWELEAAGDVDGDSVADLLVSQPNSNRVRVLYGPLTGTTTFTVTAGEEWGDYYGSETAAAGDMNGDGFGDVLIAAYVADYGLGRGYLVSGEWLDDNKEWTP